MDNRFGIAVRIREDCLPTKKEVYNHFLYIKDQKLASEEWTKFTSFATRISCLQQDICEIWDRTAIPHSLATRNGTRHITKLIISCQKLCKVPFDRRKPDHTLEMVSLFDVALCIHKSTETCTCLAANKVGKLLNKLELS